MGDQEKRPVGRPPGGIRPKLWTSTLYEPQRVAIMRVVIREQVGKGEALRRLIMRGADVKPEIPLEG